MSEVGDLRIGILWRAEWDPPSPTASLTDARKLRGVFDAFSELGVAAEPVIYSDESVDAVRDQLLGLDGVLVWVNPIEQGLDRSRLDPLLREASAAGVWVSAHPDVILKIATKQILVDTNHMSWGTETRSYRTISELRAQLPERLMKQRVLVLKRHRGMGGNGVWKLEADGPQIEGGTMLRVQHAVGDSFPEQLSLDEFIARCRPYFAAGGSMVDQPYQARLGDGMIRCYMTHDRVVGFAHQYPRGLLPPASASDTPAPAKVFELPSAAAYSDLRMRMESEWMPQLLKTVGLEPLSLPVIWDADFFHGENTSSGKAYVLCEINASSTFAFPEHAMPTVAEAAIRRIQENERRCSTHGSEQSTR
jgi:hypothetical protein